MLFSSSTLSEVFDRLKALSEIERQRSAVVADVTSTRKEVADEQATLAQQSEQASTLVKQIDQQRVRSNKRSRPGETTLPDKCGRGPALAADRGSKGQSGGRGRAKSCGGSQTGSRRTGRGTGSAGGHGTQANSDYTPQSWASTLLSRCSLPATADNIKAIVAWEMAEGGNWANTALYNPLNTTMPNRERQT